MRTPADLDRSPLAPSYSSASIPSCVLTITAVVCYPIAFHWIGTDGASTMLEIARVLKPGGNLILIWNLEDPAQPWVNKLRSEYEQYEAGEFALPLAPRRGG